MNAYLVWLFCAATLVGGSSIDEGPMQYQSLLLNLSRRAITVLNAESSCDPEVTSCKDNVLTFCAYGIAKVTIPCSSLFNSGKGYCDCENVQCTESRMMCLQPDGNKCQKVGKTPDPRDCRKFTYCNGKTKKTFSCPEGMSYDAKKKICGSEKPCQPVACNPKKVLEYVPFPSSPNYYLFCYFGVPEVMECSQSGYSMQNNKCQFQCTEPGLFVDPKPENCKKGMWHSCVATRRGELLRKTNYCGKDDGNQLYFNEQSGLCLPEDTCEGQQNEPEQTTTTNVPPQQS